MMAPHPTSLARRIAVGLAGVAALVQIGATQFGTIAILGKKPAAAMNLPYGHARPDGLLAWDLAQAGAPARQITQIAGLGNAGTPLNEPAFAAVARATDPNGAGSAALDHAWRLSRRDPWVLQVLFDRARTRGDSRGEVAALNGILQLQLPASPMRENLLADLGRADVFAQTVAMMRRNQHWRHGFFAGLHVDQDHGQSLAALIAALRENGSPLAVEDMAEVLGPLMYHRQADPALANQIWRAWLGQADPWAWAADSESTSRLPFDWSLGHSASWADTGNARMLKFTGKDGPAAPIATKLVFLPAGRYQFVARPDKDLAASVISAILVCDAQNILLPNGATWSSDHGCRSAELRLVADSTDGTILSAGLRPLSGG